MRFLLIDDHQMVREGLCAVLSGLYGDIEMVQAGSVAEGREAIRQGGSFDLAILDMMLPDGSGTELMDELERHHPEVPMIVVSGDARFMDEAMRRGALGFVTKAADSDELLEAIGSVLAGRVYVPNTMGRAMARRPVFPDSLALADDLDGAIGIMGPQPRLPSFSKRQESVLRLVMQGLSNRDISQRLELAEGTIKVHVSAIFKELRVHSRTQAVLTARRMKLL